jgi:hypothetical protein
MDTSLSIPEAAAYYNVTPKTIRRWIKSGKVAAHKQLIDKQLIDRGFEWRIVVDNDSLDIGNDTIDMTTDTLDSKTTTLQMDNNSVHGYSPEYLALLKSYEDLQQRHIELAGQLGFVQAQLLAAQEQVRLLTTEKAPERQEPEPEGKQPWWRRFFS